MTGLVQSDDVRAGRHRGKQPLALVVDGARGGPRPGARGQWDLVEIQCAPAAEPARVLVEASGHPGRLSIRSSNDGNAHEPQRSTASLSGGEMSQSFSIS
jgi:hypothetical protein